MIRKLYNVIILCSLGLTLSAQNIEQVYTDDGSIYEGYISEQIPGERISVYALKATLSVPTKNISTTYTVYRHFSVLPESAKQWFRENGDTTSIVLSSFEHKGEIVDDVIIFSKDAKETKFVSFANKTYVLPWNTVKKTVKLNSSYVPYGIQDIVTLKNGDRLTGHIKEQILGDSIKLRKEDGNIVIIPVQDIVSLNSAAVDMSTPIWKQTPLLDRIVLEDGSEDIDGFISSRTSGSSITIIRRDSGYEESIPLVKIKKYQKMYNPEFVAYDSTQNTETYDLPEPLPEPQPEPQSQQQIQPQVPESNEYTELEVQVLETTSSEEIAVEVQDDSQNIVPDQVIRNPHREVVAQNEGSKWSDGYSSANLQSQGRQPKIMVNGKEVATTETLSDKDIRYATYLSIIDVNQGELVKIEIINRKCDQKAQLYKAEITKYGSTEDDEFSGTSCLAMSLDEAPMYQADFKINENGNSYCEVEIRKKGVYFLSFNGLDSVLVINANYL